MASVKISTTAKDIPPCKNFLQVLNYLLKHGASGNQNNINALMWYDGPLQMELVLLIGY